VGSDEAKGNDMTQQYTTIRITEETRTKLADIMKLIERRAAEANLPVRVSLGRLIDDLADERLSEMIGHSGKDSQS
jgi:hypothetical protein